ncbi:UvrD-helicase domain-containing protein [Brachymonas sp.]|uniref:UvrD-helicase domain-containing protein n=1 Tax=Brachymonas sp. TaxID=1936292 RepID=UPI0035ADEA8C
MATLFDDDFFAPAPAPAAAAVDPAHDPLLRGLNPEQLRAVTLPDEHALILAGAGSGKTRVLTTRIAWLLQQNRVSPGGLMAVTFTNKAAREMTARLTAMLPLNVHGMWIGTFHGLCNRFLRAHYKVAQLPQGFQILDTQDQLSAIKRLYKQFDINDEQFPAKQMQWFIGGCKEEGMRAADVPQRDAESRKKAEIYALYEAQCQREGVVDFGELMLRSYEILRDYPLVRTHYQRRFRHILVDEFQDTNRLQYLWLKMFVPEVGSGIAPNAIFAVGDDDQSIYAFRGARVGNMNDFVRELHVRHQIKLEQNYRSFSNILDSANALISHNTRRLGKNLRTDAGAGDPVRVVELPSDMAEAHWMVEEIRQLVGEGRPRREIAVLYRSNAQSRVIESTLFNAGIPYRVYGGLRFFERAEIKHALAYLRLLDNPRDDTSFLRVVNFPPRGIGARTLEHLQDAARASQAPLHDAVSQVPGKAGANLSSFVAKIDALREQAETLTLKEIVENVLEHSGLLEHYRSERDGADRVENLQELVNAAESFVSQEGFGRDRAGMEQVDAGVPGTEPGALPNGEPEDVLGDGETLSPLAAFLTHAALESGDNQAQAGQDAVQLMTVHAAKGLEFDVVFISGLEEGLFPHDNALNDADGLEEERRLMYVAITRARQRLYLSHAQTRLLHGQTRYNIRSRFFDELPEECLKWITPRRSGFSEALHALESAWDGEHWNRDVRQAVGWKGTSTATADVPRKQQEGGHGLRKGMRVFHTKFGEGTVLMLEGQGADAKAQIQFPRHGVKWLALGIAKLTPVES